MNVGFYKAFQNQGDLILEW